MKPHPRVDEIWARARDVTPDSLKDLESAFAGSLRRADHLLGMWAPQKQQFIAFRDLLQQGMYEELETRFSGCDPEIAHLYEVKEWHKTAICNIEHIRHSINLAREEISRRNRGCISRIDGLSSARGPKIWRDLGRNS